jgi:hypothetical protein
MCFWPCLGTVLVCLNLAGTVALHGYRVGSGTCIYRLTADIWLSIGPSIGAVCSALLRCLDGDCPCAVGTAIGARRIGNVRERVVCGRLAGACPVVLCQSSCGTFCIGIADICHIRCLSRLLQLGRKDRNGNCDQYADNGDDDQEFCKRKSLLVVCVSFLNMIFTSFCVMIMRLIPLVTIYLAALITLLLISAMSASV